MEAYSGVRTGGVTAGARVGHLEWTNIGEEEGARGAKVTVAGEAGGTRGAKGAVVYWYWKRRSSSSGSRVVVGGPSFR